MENVMIYSPFDGKNFSYFHFWPLLPFYIDFYKAKVHKLYHKNFWVILCHLEAASK